MFGAIISATDPVAVVALLKVGFFVYLNQYFINIVTWCFEALCYSDLRRVINE